MPGLTLEKELELLHETLNGLLQDTNPRNFSVRAIRISGINAEMHRIRSLIRERELRSLPVSRDENRYF